MQSAKDQAALAARCAATIRERWPEARVAVVTGRGARSRGLLTGEVIDRAWSLLSREAGPLDAAGKRATSEILVDQVSASLLETRFELRPASGQSFALGGERLDEDAARLLLGKPTPCVGRERELVALETTLAECRDEQVARAVLVLAPPGLGKSRLRHEFLRRIEARGQPVTLLMGRGDPMKAKASYGLLGEALRGKCGIRPEQDLAQQQTLLREWMRRDLSGNRAQQATEFLGEICGVLFSDAESPQLRAARQDPHIMSDQVEQTFLDVVRAMTREQPVLLILEDLHWADALTVKLVQAALRTLADHAFMVLGLARPEVQELYPNLWSGVVQAQPLLPLPRKAGERLVRQILGSDAESALVARVVEQSAGNPLFLEELIRAVAERKTGELPETVAAMLQARIGRLEASSRRMLRAASVFGETFFENGVRRLLAAMHGPESSNALEELVREEIIEAKRERRFSAEPEYRFRHALMRDAAYGLLSAEEAVAWHATAGLFLEALGEAAVVLAEHFRLGQQSARAVGSYIKAAEQAYEAGDFDAALLCVERGLACGAAGVERGVLLSIQVNTDLWLDRYQDILIFGPETLELLIPGSKPWCATVGVVFIAAVAHQRNDLLAQWMGPFLSTNPSPEGLADYIRSAGLLACVFYMTCQNEAGDLLRQRNQQLSASLPAQELSAWSLIHTATGVHHDLVLKLPYSNWRQYQQGFEAARQANDRFHYPALWAYTGKVLFELGRRTEARQMLRDSLNSALQVAGENSKLVVRVYLARFLASTAQPDDTLEAEQLARLCLGAQIPAFCGMARGVLAQVALYRGDAQTAETEARAACQLVQYFPGFKPDIVALLSRILAAQDKHTEALAVCEEALLEQDKSGIETYGLLDLYVALIEARARLGHSDAARQAIERALPILHRRLQDIPEGEMRTIYLSEVRENAALLKLAEERSIALPWVV